MMQINDVDRHHDFLGGLSSELSAITGTGASRYEKIPFFFPLVFCGED